VRKTAMRRSLTTVSSFSSCSCSITLNSFSAHSRRPTRA
jgi:hypothetical protein